MTVEKFKKEYSWVYGAIMSEKMVEVSNCSDNGWEKTILTGFDIESPFPFIDRDNGYSLCRPCP